jgi:adenylosuccinate lyase
MGEAVMMELAMRGVGRQEAHEIVRSSAMIAHEGGKHFKDVLLANKEVAEYLSEEDIANLVDPDKYIGTAVEQVEAVVAKLQKK